MPTPPPDLSTAHPPSTERRRRAALVVAFTATLAGALGAMTVPAVGDAPPPAPARASVTTTTAPPAQFNRTTEPAPATQVITPTAPPTPTSAAPTTETPQATVPSPPTTAPAPPPTSPPTPTGDDSAAPTPATETWSTTSTMYCLPGTTASGRPVGDGLVAVSRGKFRALAGTSWKVVSGPAQVLGRVYQVADWGPAAHFDMWTDDCGGATTYGRHDLVVERAG